jgi:hypothetical protein
VALDFNPEHWNEYMPRPVSSLNLNYSHTNHISTTYY